MSLQPRKGVHLVIEGPQMPVEIVFQSLADWSKRPVVYDQVAIPRFPDPVITEEVYARLQPSPTRPLSALREAGYRVIEQRMPRRAYVVVGYPTKASPGRQPMLSPDEERRIRDALRNKRDELIKQRDEWMKQRDALAR